MENAEERADRSAQWGCGCSAAAFAFLVIAGAVVAAVTMAPGVLKLGEAEQYVQYAGFGFGFLHLITLIMSILAVRRASSDEARRGARVLARLSLATSIVGLLASAAVVVLGPTFFQSFK